VAPCDLSVDKEWYSWNPTLIQWDVHLRSAAIGLKLSGFRVGMVGEWLDSGRIGEQTAIEKVKL